MVVWVHGGGYRVGDKAQQVASKVALFASRGWIFASVNYRLSRPAAGAAKYPDHYDDVATAVTWLRHHLRRHGGNPRRHRAARPLGRGRHREQRGREPHLPREVTDRG